jgi:hypothetical protein
VRCRPIAVLERRQDGHRTGGELAYDSESTDIAWVEPAKIPELTMHPSMKLRIDHYLENRDRPYLG